MSLERFYFRKGGKNLMLKEFKEKVLSTDSQFYLYDDKTKFIYAKEV